MMLLAAFPLLCDPALAQETSDRVEDPESLPEPLPLPVRTTVPGSRVKAARPRTVSRGGLNGPPLRFELRSSFRNGIVPGPVGEIGVQYLRRGKFTFDAALSYHGQHNLGIRGPWRTVGAVDLQSDVLYEVGSWLAVGPSTGWSMRLFRQQGLDVSNRLIPTVGARTHMGFIRARRWSLGVSSRLNLDLVRTDIVLETAEIIQMSPFEVQVGARLQLGHGRDRRKEAT